MSGTTKKPVFETITYRIRSKKRFALVTSRSQLDGMRTGGHLMRETARLEGEASRAGATVVAIYVLPTNNVLEIYRMPGGEEVGYLFTSLDVWINMPGSVDYE